MRRSMNLVMLLMVVAALLFASCATEEEAVRPQRPLDGIDLEFLGSRIELRNPSPRAGEEVEMAVVVRNSGNRDVRRVQVIFYDNLRLFASEQIDLEPGGQIRLISRWRATPGSHTLSVIIDPARHFKELDRKKTEVSTSVFVR